MDNIFDKPDTPSPSEIMAIGTFIIFMFVTWNFMISAYFGMIMLGIFSLLSREK
jgi:hypothetical protein